MLWIALHFPPLAPGTLAAIAAWACQFTPRVALEPPQAVLLEVAGSLRLFGGLEALTQKLRGGIAEMGLEASLRGAPGARAALWLARGRADTLEELPLEATGFEPETLELLRAVGVRTLSELLALPREGLARRCGPQLVEQLDQALGRAPEPRTLFAPPARFSAGFELPGEVAHAEGLLFAARRLLVQLEGLLAARHAGVRRFTLVMLDAAGESRLRIGLAAPAREAARLAALLRERLATLVLARPVEAIRLEAEDFTPLEARTAGMFGDAGAEAEAWARLLERLRARLGHAAVHGLAVHPDHRPEHAWRRVEPGEWEPREARAPGPRPLWLLEPRRIREGAYALLAGPERIESGWWDGDEASRDYFVARSPDDSLAWIYREAGAWFLHGLFA